MDCKTRTARATNDSFSYLTSTRCLKVLRHISRLLQSYVVSGYKQSSLLGKKLLLFAFFLGMIQL